MMHEIIFYHFSNNLLVDTKKYSKTQNLGNEYISISPIKGTSNQIFAYVKTTNSTQVPYILFKTEKELTSFIEQKNLSDGIWFGVVFLVIIITFLYYIIKKNTDSLYYLIHTCSLFIIQSAFSGYLFSYLSVLPSWILDRAVVLSCSLLTFGTVKFIYNNFKRQVGSNTVLIIYNSISAIAGIHLVFSIITYTQLTIVLTSYLTLLLSLGSITICFWGLYKRLNNSILFLLSFSLFLFSSLAFTMKDLGVININEIYINILVKLSLLIEFFVLASVIIRSLINEQKFLEKTKLDKEIAFNAKKIHHDIQSPLSALQFISDSISEKLNTQERSLLEHSISRIDLIVQSLLSTNEDESEDKEQLMYPIIHRIFTEKKIEFRSKKITISLEDSIDRSIFCKVNPSMLMRILSNLINNSSEATKVNRTVSIILKLETSGRNLIITVKDNGIGISDIIKKQLFEYGASFNKKQGKGIGLAQTKEYIESINGDVSLHSQEDQGTNIRVTIPICSPPQWFTNTLSISNKKVCIVDDEKSIHLLWESILNIPSSFIKSFYSPDEFSTFLLSTNKEEYIFLIDFNFKGVDKNGVQLIKDSNISKNSHLVTSQFSDKKVQSYVNDLNIKMIPKDTIKLIKID